MLLNTREANGSIELKYSLFEEPNGFQREYTKSVVLSTLPHNSLILTDDTDRFERFEVTVDELINLIKVHGKPYNENIQNISSWNCETEDVETLKLYIERARVRAKTEKEKTDVDKEVEKHKEKYDKYVVMSATFSEAYDMLGFDNVENNLIACDYKGDCLLEKEPNFFYSNENVKSELVIIHISELLEKIEESDYFEYISSKDD
ncbi:hypothetical protein [Methanosarcina sp.]|uniref:hypothetical protein n=1 Tax=Methanosarcina sp. TaxID=2213 RepID=UPI002CCE9488|nr:hypothetical protein [Methanosarcina sp.]HOW15053.1 hypothetical protein [Methanosarcina sp.]